MKRTLLFALLATAIVTGAQREYEITVESRHPSGIIVEMLYGQLFEHIYFSANNGVWHERYHVREWCRCDSESGEPHRPACHSARQR